jgi:hypothetical protein
LLDYQLRNVEERFDLLLYTSGCAGESVAEPLRYYHNVTSNTVQLLESMLDAGVNEVSPQRKTNASAHNSSHQRLCIFIL